MRKCRCCRVRWPLDCYKPNNRCAGGRLPTCRACQGGRCKEAGRRYYLAHRELVIARVAASRAQLRADVLAVRQARAA